MSVSWIIVIAFIVSLATAIGVTYLIAKGPNITLTGDKTGSTAHLSPVDGIGAGV